MRPLSAIAGRPPRAWSDALGKGSLRSFIDMPYPAGRLVWIAADALGRHAILRKNRLPVPLGIPVLWRPLLRRSRIRGVMVAGGPPHEGAAAARVRRELERIGRPGLPVTRLFGDKYPEALCMPRRQHLLHLTGRIFAEVPPPTRLCVILAPPRTGSTLLAELLHRAGLAPAMPQEIFNDNRDPAQHGGLYDWETLVDRYCAFRTSPSGLCTFKLQGKQLLNMRRLDCPPEQRAMLRDAKVIMIKRRDHFAQAASLHRAIRDNLWHVRPGTDAPPPEQVRGDTDADTDHALLAAMRRIHIDERLVEFAAVRIFRPENVLRLTYEELATDPLGALDRVVAHLGEPVEPAALDELEPGTLKTRDIYTDDLAARVKSLMG